jgi:hypothetical protein
VLRLLTSRSSRALAGNLPLDTDEVEDDIDDADFQAEEIGGRD